MTFDRDTEALAIRERLNAANARENLEEWMAAQIPMEQPRRILDLGCGRGKQLTFFAKRWPAASLLGIDASPQAVAEVRAAALRQHLNNIEAQESDFSNCLDKLRGEKFDLVMSTYAIYYAKDVVSFVRLIAGYLNPRGMCFVVGYADGSNQELFALVNAVRGGALRSDDFLSPSQIQSIASGYQRVQTSRLSNEIRFENASNAMDWWRNSNTYCGEIDAEITSEIGKVISRQGYFALTKNSLAVKLFA